MQAICWIFTKTTDVGVRAVVAASKAARAGVGGDPQLPSLSLPLPYPPSSPAKPPPPPLPPLSPLAAGCAIAASPLRGRFAAGPPSAASSPPLFTLTIGRTRAGLLLLWRPSRADHRARQAAAAAAAALLRRVEGCQLGFFLGARGAHPRRLCRCYAVDEFEFFLVQRAVLALQV